MVLGRSFFHFVEYCFHHRRRKFLRGKAVASADNAQVAAISCGPRFVQCCQHIQIKRLAQAARLFGTVEHCHDGRCFRKGCHKGTRVERTVEPDFEQTKLFAGKRKPLDCFFHSTRARTHHHDQAFRIRRAYVVEQVIASASSRGKAVHHILHDCGAGPDSTDCWPRGLEKKRPGFARYRAAPGGLVTMRVRDDQLHSFSLTSARRSSSLSGVILFTSCEVRNPSKKCKKGIRDSRDAACAMSAKSEAS